MEKTMAKTLRNSSVVMVQSLETVYVDYSSDSHSQNSQVSLKSNESLTHTTNSFAAYSPSPSRFNSKSVATTKKQSLEEIFRKFFFGSSHQLLYSYCDALLKQEVNEYHVSTLLNFFATRGEIASVVTQLSEREIDSTNLANPLFRGNTPFIALYSNYLKKYCSTFLNKTTNNLCQNYPIPSIATSLEQSNSAERAKGKRELLHIFSSLLLENVFVIPNHHMFVLRSIYNHVMEKRGRDEAKHAFTTLFYLRYILTPFLKYPSVLKSLQQTISECSTSNYSEIDQSLSELKIALDTVMKYVLTSPLGFDDGLLNYSTQETSLVQLSEIIKNEMKKISRFYDGDFSEVFTAVKGRRDNTQTSNVLFAVVEMNSWTESKISSVEEQNDSLRREVDKLKKTNSLLRERILKAQSLL